jgi:hypothetical protein
MAMTFSTDDDALAMATDSLMMVEREKALSKQYLQERDPMVEVCPFLYYSNNQSIFNCNN